MKTWIISSLDKFKKRIVAAATIWGNTVHKKGTLFKFLHFSNCCPRTLFKEIRYLINRIEDSGSKSISLFCLRFQFQLMYIQANLPETNPFYMCPNGFGELFQMFLVFGMYNFACFISFNENFLCSIVRRSHFCNVLIFVLLSNFTRIASYMSSVVIERWWG